MLKAVLNFLIVNKKRLILLSLFSLILFASAFFLSYLVNPGQASQNFLSKNTFPLNVIVFVIESVITHYILIFEVILPIMRKERSYFKAAIIGLIFFLVKFAFNYYSLLADKKNQVYNSATTSLPENSITWILILSYFFILLASFSAALLVEWIHKERERITLEKQKTEAELSALKHQINPHFLFNSLSFIYGRVMKVDKETADSVLMLANIMRYALGKNLSVNGTVNIMDELDHMKNVIEINQRRHNHELNILYEEQVDDQSIQIIPLVLITLVENAFKHGDLYDTEQPLFIKISTNINELLFEIRNKKGNGIKELSNGVGLQNIIQQLSLTYGDHYKFSIEQNDLNFKVLLKISFVI